MPLVELTCSLQTRSANSPEDISKAWGSFAAYCCRLQALSTRGLPEFLSVNTPTYCLTSWGPSGLYNPMFHCRSCWSFRRSHLGRHTRMLCCFSRGSASSKLVSVVLRPARNSTRCRLQTVFVFWCKIKLSQGNIREFKVSSRLRKRNLKPRVSS